MTRLVTNQGSKHSSAPILHIPDFYITVEAQDIIIGPD